MVPGVVPMVPRRFQNIRLLIFIRFCNEATVVPRWFRMVPALFGITLAMSSYNACIFILNIRIHFCMEKGFVLVTHMIPMQLVLSPVLSTTNTKKLKSSENHKRTEERHRALTHQRNKDADEQKTSEGMKKP